MVCLVLALAGIAASVEPDPGVRAAVRAAEDLQSEGKKQEAMSAYEKILEEYPDTALRNDILIKTARSYSRLGDDDSAIRTYLKLVSESPDTIEASQAVSLMMNLYHQRYRFDEVMAMATHIVQRFPGTESAAMALYRSAGYLYNQGEYGKAIQIYENFMEQFPKSIMRSTSFNRLISLYTREGMFEKAETMLAGKLKQDPTDKYMLRQLARVYQEQGSYDKALALYQQILTGSPNDVDTYERLGELYAEKGDEEKALAEWSKITSSAPGQYSRHQMLAYILKSHGFYDQAAAEYRKALKLQPGIYYIYTQLANIYVVKKQFDLAVDVYLDALTTFPITHPNRASITTAMMELCDLEGMHHKAISRLETHLAGSPDNLPALLTLADFYFHQGRFQDSLQHFRRVAAIYPDEGRILFDHAQTLERERQFGPAIEFYQAALDISSNSIIFSQALAHIGQVRSQLQQPQEAIASLSKLISEIDSGNPMTSGQAGSQTDFWLSAYMLMGDVYRQQTHDMQAALSTYMDAKRKALAQSSNAGISHEQFSDLDLRIAECYRLMGKYDEAEKLLDSMQTKYESRSIVAQIARLRGDCYFNRGSFDEALVQYQAAIQWPMSEDWVNDALDRIVLIKDHPDHSPESLLNVHAQVERLRKLGQYDKALEICVSAVKERGADATVDRIRLKIGELLALQMKAQEAVSAYEELIQSESQLASEAQFRIAGLYHQQLGDQKRAIAAYSTLIEEYPDSILVASARKQIRQIAFEKSPGANLP